jgi:hypothetical protein
MNIDPSISTSDMIQINRFSNLYNKKDIIFCKTDYLQKEFDHIKSKGYPVILLTGNSDINITNDMVEKMPGNVVKWYCQNDLVSHPKLIPIPLGLENIFVSKRRGHGVAWENARVKHTTLSSNARQKNIEPDKLIYANFDISTNVSHRTSIKDICLLQSHITWQEPDLSYPEFIDQVLAHKATLCPAGNGIDTHRLYEVLYCNRIPITVKLGDFAIYKELYHFLPIVVLDNEEQLGDAELLSQRIASAQQKKIMPELLNFDYWASAIQATQLKDLPRKKLFRWF